MKKILVTLTLLTIIFLNLPAQKIKDALYLKNGSIIYGKLVEISDNQYRMETSDGSKLIFKAEEVEKFAKEVPEFDGRKETGYGFSLEAGLMVGAQNTSYSAPFCFNFTGSYTINTANIISLGSGVEFLGVAYTPVFFEYKHLLRDTKATPFVFARAGGLLHLGGDGSDESPYNQYGKHDYEGGLSGAFGTGITWAKDGFESYVSFAYRYAKTSYRQDSYNNYDAEYVTTFNRLEIKFGFIF